MKTLSEKLLTCTIAILLAGVLPQASMAEADEGKIDFVVFGDSLSDTGNRFFDTGSMNTPPYEFVASQNLIPSLPYAIGGPTYTNGKVWVQHLIRSLGRPGASQAALRSDGIAANYAYSGARASNAFPLPPNGNRNLGEQVDLYIADVPASGISPETVHIIFIGGNDIAGGIFLASQGFDPTPVIVNAIGSVFNNALELAAAGAHRFLIVTAPNPGSIPAFGGNPSAIFGGAQLTTAFNCALVGTGPSRPFCPPQPPGVPTVADALRGVFSAEVTVFDAQDLFDDITASPGLYGLTNTSQPCIQPAQAPFRCENPGEYLYWDNIHPTATVHRILGDAVIDAWTN
jgi:phospholipase/lecithinase/hemolysin